MLNSKTRIIIGLFLCLAVLFISSACTMTVLPRDEIEIYEKGLHFWDSGNYEMAIKLLTPFAEKDSLYAPIYTILAESYYNLHREKEAFEMLDKSQMLQESEIVDNLFLTFESLRLELVSKEERVSFAQYVEDVANRYAIDKALLYAIIKEGSDFRLEGDLPNNRLGIMALDRDQANNLGLTITEHYHKQDIAVFEEDDRFDPAKSIYHTARYLSELIEKNRVRARNSDLLASLHSFYNIEKDFLSYRNPQIETIVDYYRYFRHNQLNKENANHRFYEQNHLESNPFKSNSVVSTPTYQNGETISQYKESRLSTPLYLNEPRQRASYYNNIALICEMLNDYDNAAMMYDIAYRKQPANEIILFNYGLFHFDQGNYGKAYELLKQISLESVYSEEVAVIMGYCLLLDNDLSSLWEHLSSLKIEKQPHLLNLKGLYFTELEDYREASFQFFTAFGISQTPIFAANYLAAVHQEHYSRISYASLTRFSKISRQYDTGFIWPVELRHISSGFGWRPSPFGITWRQRLEMLVFHNGIDIPGREGLPVKASADGEVITSQQFPLGGETIFIQHPENYITTYLHLQRRFVEEGDNVHQGQIIGLLGNTGQSTGPHLHFGMFNSKNQPANPLNYLPVY